MKKGFVYYGCWALLVIDAIALIAPDAEATATNADIRNAAFLILMGMVITKYEGQ